MEKGKQPMLNIIGISGKIGSGKDTTAELIQLVTKYGINNGREIRNIAERVFDEESVKNFILQNNTWQIVKYAENLKKIASVLTGIPREKFEDQEFKKTKMPSEWGDITVRQFLQTLGTNALRDQVNEDIWINSLFSDFKPESHWLITDVRFPNEAEAVKKKGGIVVRVDRGLVTGTHPSETALDDYDFDYTIQNHGTLTELLENVIAFCETYNL